MGRGGIIYICLNSVHITHGILSLHNVSFIAESVVKDRVGWNYNEWQLKKHIAHYALLPPTGGGRYGHDYISVVWLMIWWKSTKKCKELEYEEHNMGDICNWLFQTELQLRHFRSTLLRCNSLQLCFSIHSDQSRSQVQFLNFSQFLSDLSTFWSISYQSLRLH